MPGGRSIVALTGELDLSTIPRMERPLFEQIQQRSAVLVDLTDLTFIDSSGIGVLIQAFRESHGNSMSIVVRLGSQVERVFTIAAVGDVVPVYPDRAQALAGLDSMNGDRAGPRT